MQRIRFSYRILLKIKFSRQIFEKTQISHFIKIRPVGAVVPFGQTDGHDETNSRFSKFCERA
jgi:hypothetical protein